MSFRDEKLLSLLGSNLDNLPVDDLKETSTKLLNDNIHGICFSLYEGDQKPGDLVSDEQIL